MKRALRAADSGHLKIEKRHRWNDIDFKVATVTMERGMEG